MCIPLNGQSRNDILICWFPVFKVQMIHLIFLIKANLYYFKTKSHRNKHINGGNLDMQTYISFLEDTYSLMKGLWLLCQTHLLPMGLLGPTSG